jgi:membrane-associated phospholipid phosphatase
VTRARLLAASALLATIVFLVLAAIVASGRFERVDTELMLAARTVSAPAVDAAMATITELGGPWVLVPLIAVVVVWCAARGDRPAAVAMALVGIAADPVNRLLKHTFERARPELWDRPHLISFAFPSGHAMVAVAIYGMIALVLSRAYPRAALPTWAVALLVALLVGASRIYLGVHWPTDVLAGYAAGLILLVAGALGLSRSTRRGDPALP